MAPHVKRKYNIKKFNTLKIKPHSTWLLIGSRNSGKTVLLNDLLYHNTQQFNIDISLVLTRTTPTRNLFHDPKRPNEAKLPKECVRLGDYDYSLVESWYAMSEKLAEISSKPRSRYLILDDMMYDTKIMKSATQRQIHMNGRHSFNTVFNTTQHFMNIPPDIRGNLDYIFAFADGSFQNQQNLFKMFFGDFPCFDDFKKVFTACTHNYGCLVLDRTVKSGNFEDKITYYRANPNVPPYKLARSVYFRLSQKHTKDQKPAKLND